MTATVRFARGGVLGRLGLVAVLIGSFCVALLDPPVASATSTPLGEGSGFCASVDPGATPPTANLGANYDGVYACGPEPGIGSPGYGSPDQDAPSMANFFEYSPNGFQCTELANRFLYDRYDLAPVSDSDAPSESLTGEDYAETVASKYSIPLDADGTEGDPYLAGDIVSLTGDGGFGHVAVVTKSTYSAADSSSGDYRINLIEENAPLGPKGSETKLQVTNWKLAMPAGANVSAFDFDAFASVPTWTEMNPNAAPSPRAVATEGWDAATGQLILFGGGQCIPNSSCNVYADTWMWSGTTWTKLNPTRSPPARTEAAMAFDPQSKQLVLFGGYSASEKNLSDTWDWTGSTWEKLKPAESPTPRHDASLGYDPASRRLILFGGSTQFNGGPMKSNTWAWNGSSWSKLAPKTSPPSLAASALAWDSSSDQLILFGGDSSSDYQANDETWLWTGSTWNLLSPQTSPAGRWRAAMSMDTGDKQLVLFGGYGTDLVDLSDTWSWNGTTWTNASPATSPTPRADAALGYFGASTSQLVLFGGSEDQGSDLLNDTWGFR